ncbi:uncharacterized protein LOC105761615 [Gossypium raimondii]|uniref:uncharacterized protein LOC105761615 n=1 Tax=Gossypium raimondii TaxID=29730 RepID=UPI00063AE997|nr:uncharacterized protein LOC105761615 [Gossypium raimondii]
MRAMASEQGMSSWTDLLHSSTKLLEQAAPSAQFPPLQRNLDQLEALSKKLKAKTLRNLDQLEALSKKLKAKTLRTEAPSQSIADTRLLAQEGINAEQLTRDLKSFELKTTFEDVFPAEATSVEEYLQQSHKEAGQFKHRSFPYYDQLTAIYARDRATRKDAQTAANVFKEINVQDVSTTDINEERNEFYDYEANVSLDDMDISDTEPRPDRNQGGSTSSKKKKKNSDASDHFSFLFLDAATLLAENMQAIGEQISRSIASDVVVQQKSDEFQIIQEKVTNLYPTLCEIESLIVDERYQALSKIPDHPTQMLVFFSLPSDVRLEWVRRFLTDH